jgi:hypothetical protein
MFGRALIVLEKLIKNLIVPSSDARLPAAW